MAHCQVAGCRFKFSHTTRHHRCGRCNEYGHGISECLNQIMKDNLQVYFNQKLTELDYCKGEHDNDEDKCYHNSESHYCKRCGRRHIEQDCIIQPISNYHNFNILFDKYDLNRFINYSRSIQRPIVININIGMGCCIFIKTVGSEVNTGNIMGIFMHSDSWGQYGEKTNDKPLYDLFVEGAVEVPNNQFEIDNNIDIIDYSRCPICRTSINKANVYKLYGSQEKCSVCLDKNVEIFFVDCGHACVCKGCFELI